MGRRRPETIHIEEFALTRRTAEEAFAFFDRPDNVKRVLPNSLAVKLESHPSDLRPGRIFAYRLERWPLEVVWDTVVSEYRPPEVVTHVKARGYFPKWSHRYAVSTKEAGKGRTRIAISLDYEVPPGLLHALEERYVIRRAMRELVREQMRAILGALERGA